MRPNDLKKLRFDKRVAVVRASRRSTSAPCHANTLTILPPSLPTTIATELTPQHRRILQLLGIPTTAYDQ
ncbi:MAG: hypothetical protein HYV60_16840 [Planctomycetia bacterium]|nr:hypothetical protein [Planctomycetia bacterium]